MQKFALVSALTAALTLTATSAFACGPTGPELGWFLAVFASPFLAIPYAAFNSVVIAAQRRQWFPAHKSRFWSWLKSSLGGWLFISVGAAIAFVLGFGLAESYSGELALALVFSTPLVFGISHLMWLHSRRNPGNDGNAI